MNEMLGTRLRMLEGTGLIRQAAREPEPEYAFRHALSLDAAYESMLKQDRHRLHHDVGECLERILGENLEEYAPILARHFDEAGDDARAVDYLSRAAESAARRYANQEAIALLDRAHVVALRSSAAGPVIGAIGVKAGRLREMCGDYDAALQTYDALEALADERVDVQMKCQAILARAAVFCAPTTRFDAPRGLETAQEALRLAIEAGDRAAESKAQWLILLVSKFNKDPERGLAAGEASALIARELGLREQLAYTLNDLYPVYLTTGGVERGVAALEEAEALWRTLGNLPLLVDTLSNLGEMRLFAGNAAEAEAILREAGRIADQTGNLWGQSYSRGVLGLVMFECGRFDEAIRLADEGVALGRQAGFAISQIMMPCVTAGCLTDLGQPQRGAEVAQEAVRAAGSYLPSWRGYPTAVEAMCVIATGDCAAATEAMTRARAVASPYDISALLITLAEVEYAVLCGEPEDVIRLVNENRAGLALFNCIAYDPILLTHRSTSEFSLGRIADAEATARDALRRAAGMGVRRGLWRTWWALSVALNAQGRASEAREAKERAREEIAHAASRAGSDDLRVSFLSRPDVRTLLEDR